MVRLVQYIRTHREVLVRTLVAALKNIAFMGTSTAMRLCFGMLTFVLLVLVVVKRTGVCRRSSGRQCFDISLHPMMAEIA